MFGSIGGREERVVVRQESDREGQTKRDKKRTDREGNKKNIRSTEKTKSISLISS